MYSRDDLHRTIQRLSTLRMYMQPRVVPTIALLNDNFLSVELRSSSF